MRVLTCAATRRRLHAFHDEELPVGDQIAVSAHLDWCDECAASYADLRLLRVALRRAMPGRPMLSKEDAASFQAGVVGRAAAEQTFSPSAQLREMFDDMHFVYAGLGAAVAAIVCVVIMLGMMRFATSGQPRSLAAIAGLLAAPTLDADLPLLGSNQNPLSIGARVQLPRPVENGFWAATVDRGEVVVAFAAVLTREGRIANVELLRASGTPDMQPGAVEAKYFEDLFGAASRARFEPAIMAGAPVAVNMVWIVAHTTVRGAKTGTFEPPIAPAAPIAKKRTAQQIAAPLSRSTA